MLIRFWLQSPSLVTNTHISKLGLGNEFSLNTKRSINIDRFETVTIEIENEQSTAEVRDVASDIASDLGFDKDDCAQVALAVSEIVGNAVKHAGKGTLSIRLSGNKKGLEFLIKDSGQGIKNLKKVMQEGYSSKVGSLGVGLNAAKRAMDELVIRSKPGMGTRVIMKKYLPIPEEEIEYGIISLNDERYTVNGDAFIIKEFEGDKVLLAVIDGTGNGLHAYEVATFVKKIINENYRSDLVTIVKKCHRSIRKAFDVSLVRSCVLEILLLKPRSLEYVGVGDTTIDVMGTSPKIHPISQMGIVGDFRLPNLKLQKFRCRRKIIIIMCSDGIKSRFSEEDLPLDRDAQHIANFIMENYCRQYGDATVLVAKRKR